LGAAQELVQKRPADPVPMQLRNAPTKAMKGWGYGGGYQHAHQFDGAISGMDCFPEELVGTEFYHPLERGIEKRVAERMEEIRQLREKARGQE